MVASQLTFSDTRGETLGEDTHSLGREETGGPTSTEAGGPDCATPVTYVAFSAGPAAMVSDSETGHADCDVEHVDSECDNPSKLAADMKKNGKFSIGSWDDCYKESFAVEETSDALEAETMSRGFTTEDFFKSSGGADIQPSPSINNTAATSIDIHPSISIDMRPNPRSEVCKQDPIDYGNLTPDEFGIFRDQDGHARAIDGRILQVANGPDNLFMQQRSNPEHQQEVTDEHNDAAGIFEPIPRPHIQPSINRTCLPSIDMAHMPSTNRRPQPSFGRIFHPSNDKHTEFGSREYRFGIRNFYWEKKDEYGVYRDESKYSRGLDGEIINEDIRRLLKRASIDEESYICLPKQASSFTLTRLVPETYNKDEINEMLTGIQGAQQRAEDKFNMKLKDVFQPLHDYINWMGTTMEDMKEDLGRIQNKNESDKLTSTSIDENIRPSIDGNIRPPIDGNIRPSIDTERPPSRYSTRKKTKEANQWEEEALDLRFSDIYHTLNNNINWLTKRSELMPKELAMLHEKNECR
ncbi:LOW QUALITY PROTEIN: hypothetical protein Bca101_059674 [Brassica carinata]